MMNRYDKRVSRAPSLRRTDLAHRLSAHTYEVKRRHTYIG